MSNQKYITISVDALDDILINVIAGRVEDSKKLSGQIKEALIENNVSKDDYVVRIPKSSDEFEKIDARTSILKSKEQSMTDMITQLCVYLKRLGITIIRLSKKDMDCFLEEIKLNSTNSFNLPTPSFEDKWQGVLYDGKVFNFMGIGVDIWGSDKTTISHFVVPLKFDIQYFDIYLKRKIELPESEQIPNEYFNFKIPN